MLNRKRILWPVIVMIVLAIAFYLWGSSSTPAGQPALTLVNSATVQDFQRSFDAASSLTRVVLLVSPT